MKSGGTYTSGIESIHNLAQLAVESLGGREAECRERQSKRDNTRRELHCERLVIKYIKEFKNKPRTENGEG